MRNGKPADLTSKEATRQRSGWRQGLKETGNSDESRGSKLRPGCDVELAGIS